MFQKIKALWRKIFKREFVHPVVNDKVNTAISDKLASVERERMAIIHKYDQELNSLLRTYFGREYPSQQDMALAFEVSNKEWLKIVRKANSTERLINLDKEAFKKQCKKVVEHVKDSQKTQAQQQ